MATASSSSSSNRGRQARRWAETEGLDVAYYEDLFPERVRLSERIVRRIDASLERQFGFWPLAIRFNYRHGFHVERMAHGHGNPFLDLDHADPLPRWRWIERAMLRWYFSPRRYVPRALLRRMRDECDTVVVANMQTPSLAPVLNAARRLGIPAIGYIASWDHAVGKGVVSKHLGTYIVQNDVMQDDLVRLHGVDPARVVVTGWPQSDSLPRETTCRGLRGARASPLARSDPSDRARDGQHADEHAVRAGCSSGG